MSPGSEYDLRGAIRCAKASATNLRRLANGPRLTDSERALYLAELAGVNAAIARLSRTLSREMGVAA